MENANTSYTPFKLNYGYHSCISYKQNIDHYSKSKSANDLANKLKELIAVC